MINEKLIISKRNSIFVLIIICVVGLLIRLYYLPQYQLSFSDDAITYFWYANDISILNKLPDYSIGSEGWSIFLSVFFSLFHFNNFNDYFTLQLFISILISVITPVPIYFLCKKFFNNTFSLFGSLLFSIEPRIIQNSLLGVTEPIYILMISTILILFLSLNKKIIYISFGLLGLISIIRLEGIILFIPLSIIFFLKFKHEQKIWRKYFIVLGIFILALLPGIIEKTLVGYDDYIQKRIGAELKYIENDFEVEQSNIPYFYDYNFENIIKFSGWLMIPIFLAFVPFGIILIFTYWKKEYFFIILTTIFCLLPGFYALLRFSDLRYLLLAYPLFCLISLFSIKWYSERFKNKNLFIIILLCGIVSSSLIFLDYKIKIDEVHENEALLIADEVVKRTKIVNQYAPESKYIVISEISKLENFPILSSDVDKILLVDIHANSLEEYLKMGEKLGLTHLVLDGRDSIYRPIFFKEVFENEEKYPYLLKIYDSTRHNFKYHVKIFEIDYVEFNQVINLEI